MDYALVDVSGNIINRIVLEDTTKWAPPEGCTVVAETDHPFEIGGTYIGEVYTAPVSPPEPEIPPQPAQILSQDLMAQFTTDDATKIQAAVTGNVQFWLLWSAMQAQKDPMLVTNVRFLAGWAALTQVLGADRMSAISAVLGVKI